MPSLQVIVDEKKKMSALKWYVMCRFFRGGRSTDGQQVRLVEEETGAPALNEIAKYFVFLSEPPQREGEPPQREGEEGEEDEEDGEEDERTRYMSWTEIGDDLLKFFIASGTDNESNGFHKQLLRLQKRGEKAVQNNIWRMLQPEVKGVFRKLFIKKVSARR